MCEALRELMKDEIEVEKRKSEEEGKEEGLKALVFTLTSIFHDFDEVYNHVIKNGAYADATREMVRKYYK